MIHDVRRRRLVDTETPWVWLVSIPRPEGGCSGTLVRTIRAADYGAPDLSCSKEAKHHGADAGGADSIGGRRPGLRLEKPLGHVGPPINSAPPVSRLMRV